MTRSHSPQMRLSAACAVVYLALGLTSRADAEEYTKSYPVTGRPEVRVHVDDSSVRVITADTHQVDFDVTHNEESGLLFGGKVRIDSRQDGNRVELTVLRKAGIGISFGNSHLRTEVHMPRDADLQIETRDGGVEVSSVNGNITIHSVDGSLKVSQLTGKIDLQSVDGAINADTLKGEARLHTTDGAVSIVRFDGQCDASSTDGSVNAEGRFDALELKSTDGSVVAKVGPGSKMSSGWSIRSVDGSVEVFLPRDFQANINAGTEDGHISLALPVTVQGEISKSKIRGTLNGGGPELTLKSTDGSIRIGSL